MALAQSAARQFAKPHAHVDEDHCPWCDQAISRDKFEEIRRRMTAEERQRLADMTEAFAREKAEAEAKAREEGRTAAEAVLSARLADTEQARAAAHEQIAALREEQDTTVTRRVEETLKQREEELRDALQKQSEAAVLAEKAKVLKLQSELADLQRKLEGKSAHELGEGSEVDLFEQLRSAFEGDRIRRVGKGVNGADVIHEVIHNGKVCGKIIYDAKNRNAWQNEFATKLRGDKLAEKADHAVLSSNRFPKGAQQLHLQDGVIVASPARVLALAELLRQQILQAHKLRISGEAREQKTEALYAFITSERCRQLLDSIDAQAGKMLELDATEEKAHRLTWERRDKLIRSVRKVQGDLTFEIDRILGTAGNGPNGTE